MDNPSTGDQARSEVAYAARAMREADELVKDARLALIRAERALTGDESQNSVQAQRVRTEAIGRDVASMAAILEALLSRS
jgi:predicted oxidoreductase